MKRRHSLVYGLLIAAWLAVMGWQVMEHYRVKAAARAALVGRGRDITTTLGLVIRSQRRFGSIVSQERLEPALRLLVRHDDVKSISLLNVASEVVASAGAPLDLDSKALAKLGEVWEERSVTLVNLMDLGTSSPSEGQPSPPIIVMPKRDTGGVTNSDAKNGPRYPWGFPPPGSTNVAGERHPPTPHEGTNGPPRDPGRGPFGRPPWMSEEDYQSMITKQGLHSFVVVLSTQSAELLCQRDFWLRAFIGIFGGLAAGGVALAWRTVAKTSDLQMRLLRTSELNNHLKEMNIAAAGLAHETRNPLNIVRGLAQMISKQEDASPEVRRKSLEITSEVDRVTAQLNQFINYSKPREVKLTSVSVDGAVEEVVRALGGDIEEKAVCFTLRKSGLRIEADEQMLRQALFNLVINAIQAVEQGREIKILSGVSEPGEAYVEIQDTGPGVSETDRKEIFRPYFTTRSDGTGLGLAVVHQIVLAHGWDIECLANEPRGAVFRISHVKISATA